MPGLEKAPYKGGFKRRQLKSYTRRFVAIVGISFALLAAPLRAEFVYVANTGDNNVSAYSINPTTGALTPVAGSPFPAGSLPTSVAVGGLRFVYVANESSSNFPFNGNVSAYSINPTTGALTPVAGSPFPAGDAPISIAVSGLRFVYVVNVGIHSPFSGNVSAYSINPTTGALTPVFGSPFPAFGNFPYSVAVGQLRFVYVGDDNGYYGTAYSINPTTGALTYVSAFPAGNAFSLSIAVSGLRFVYVANGNSGNFPFNGNVSAYSINPTTGALTPVAGSPFPAGNESVSVAVSGLRFVYVANESSSNFPFNGNVSAYSINPTTGALTPVPGSPFPTGFAPRSVAVAP